MITPNHADELRRKLNQAISDAAALRPVRELPMKEISRDLEWMITTHQTNRSKSAGFIFVPTGSKKGKANSPKTRITRWEFGHIDPYPMRCCPPESSG